VERWRWHDKRVLRNPSVERVDQERRPWRDGPDRTAVVPQFDRPVATS